MSKSQDLQTKVVNQVIAKIEQGTPPWKSPYLHSYGQQCRHNGTPFKGINAIILLMTAMENEFKSPFWLTFKQISKKGGRVIKGSTGTPVFYFKHVEKHDPTHARADAEGNVNYKFMRVTYEYNADQTTGLPDEYYRQSPHVVFDSEDNAEVYAECLLKVPAKINIINKSPSAYVFTEDYIEMTSPHLMTSKSTFISTLAHELVHWTSHKDRLDRGLYVGMTKEERATEELVAELGSAVICSRFGINADHIDNHAAYLHHYLKMLKANPSYLFKAAAKAQLAVDYLSKYWETQDEYNAVEDEKIAA